MWNIIFVAAVFITAVLLIWGIMNLIFQAKAVIKSTVLENNVLDTVKDYIGQYQYLNNVWVMAGLIVIFLLGMYLFENPIPALAACIMLGVIPSQIMFSRERKQQEKVLEQFAVALRIFTGEYTATKQINHGLRRVGEKVPDPVGKIFREAHSLIVYGESPDKVYKQMAKKLNISHAQVFASILAQAGQQGAAIIPILEDTTRNVRSAQKMSKDNSSEIDGDRFIGLCLSLMPLPVFLVLQNAFPETSSFLVDTPTGRIIVTISFLSVIIWFLLDRLLTE
ncbi:type ii secretion system protein [hydrocarbon metagenome]|uniref:Type ii secretion system protein n=1 Tax=hydrocarbon metagenome TaxID=938273 RepID=A0A0W8E9F3_9ZZZZ